MGAPFRPAHAGVDRATPTAPHHDAALDGRPPYHGRVPVRRCLAVGV